MGSGACPGVLRTPTGRIALLNARTVGRPAGVLRLLRRPRCFALRDQLSSTPCPPSPLRAARTSIPFMHLREIAEFTEREPAGCASERPRHALVCLPAG